MIIRHSASSLESGSVEKQNRGYLKAEQLSDRLLVVQRIFYYVRWSQIPPIILMKILDQKSYYYHLLKIITIFIFKCNISLINIYQHTMQKVIPQISATLTHVQRASFSKMLLDPASNPIKQRVMSTPQWPVPYYQRIYKAYPVRQKKNINLNAGPFDADDTNWYAAKKTLNKTLKGRQLVEHTQNHVKTSNYLIRKDDCESMVRAYVDDIGQFLDISNRENVRILGGKTLI